MNLIDTHTHIYLKDFESDIEDVIERATVAGVSKILLPNIDKNSVKPMLNCCDRFINKCYPMLGLHPRSVNKNWRSDLDEIINNFHEYYNLKLNTELSSKDFDNFLKQNIIAIGEVGIDLYWDKTFMHEQVEAFVSQINLALHYSLPIVIHSRESIELVLNILSDFKNLKAVLHCFPGNVEQAYTAIEMGFMIGVGGIITYKKSLIKEVVQAIPLHYILLETDAPYLAPVPFRGKRNEPSYLSFIIEEIAKIKDMNVEEVSRVLFDNSKKIFFSNSE